MNFIDFCIEEYSENFYFVRNKHIHLLGIRSCIQIEEHSDQITVNGIELSKRLSSQIVYILGSVNFQLEFIIKLLKSNERDILMVKIVKIYLLALTEMIKVQSLSDVENILDCLDRKRIKLKECIKRLELKK